MAPRRRHAAGYTMVEVMIAVVIGLIVMVAVSSIFVGSRQSFKTQEAFSQIQETGRMTSYFLGKTLRLAGYVPNPQQQINPLRIFNPAPPGQDPRTAVFATDNVASTYPGMPTSYRPGTDTIGVAFAGSVDGSVTTCLGDVLTTTQIAVNIFFVTAQDNQGVSSLNCYVRAFNCNSALRTCAVAFTRSEPLMYGVRNLQAMYGFDNNNDRTNDRWLTPSQIGTGTRTLAIQVTLTAESIDPVAGVEVTGPNVIGGRIVRPFVTTVAVRNRLVP